MTETNVFQFAQPGAFTDSLTEVLRDGACALLARAVEAEVAEVLAKYAELKTDGGRQRLVRHERSGVGLYESSIAARSAAPDCGGGRR